MPLIGLDVIPVAEYTAANKIKQDYDYAGLKSPNPDLLFGLFISQDFSIILCLET